MEPLPILLAEDNEDDVFLLQRAMTKARVTNPVQVVGDGEQVLAYLRGEGVYGDRKKYPFPVLLLLDIKMPKMNGLEVLSEVREDPLLRRLVVIVLSSSNQQRDIDQAFDLRVNSYLVKPSGTDGMTNIFQKVKNYWLTLNQYPHGPARAA
ncbi:MAG TPA: response regulator [Verrucomicrobiae bacterium]|nr:response regulator [Verrucomicrobiae bacterium]